MDLIAYIFILSIILLIVALNNIFGGIRVKKLEEELKSFKKEFEEIKRAEKRHSDYLKSLMERIAKELKVEVINEIINNDNIIDINKRKCEGRS
jgi:hypothetical protein